MQFPRSQYLKKAIVVYGLTPFNGRTWYETTPEAAGVRQRVILVAFLFLNLETIARINALRRSD
jgi:hypothetical protein